MPCASNHNGTALKIVIWFRIFRIRDYSKCIVFPNAFMYVFINTFLYKRKIVRSTFVFYISVVYHRHVYIETYHLKTNIFFFIYIDRLTVRAIFNNLNT